MSKTTRGSLTTTGAFNKAVTESVDHHKSIGTRTGKNAAPFWMPAAAKKQLDYLTVEHDTTQQSLLTEALNDLFKKYGKPPIA